MSPTGATRSSREPRGRTWPQTQDQRHGRHARTLGYHAPNGTYHAPTGGLSPHDGLPTSAAIRALHPADSGGETAARTRSKDRHNIIFYAAASSLDKNTV